MTGENVAYLPRGDTKIPYIPWKVGAEALDSICCRWMWDIKETRLDAGGWTVTGRLTLVSADGEMHHKEATGYQMIWDVHNSHSKQVKDMLANVNVDVGIVVQYPAPSPQEVAERTAFKRALSWYGVYPK